MCAPSAMQDGQRCRKLRGEGAQMLAVRVCSSFFGVEIQNVRGLTFEVRAW